MSDSMNWPRKVFLESTALFQLGSKLQKPELAKLVERREYLKCELLVSEVSWAEYVRQRVDKIDALTRDLQTIGSRLGEWDQNPQNILTTHTELGQFRETIGSLYEQRAKEAGIQILTLPPIDVSRLFRMSIERIPPFEDSREDKSEKGFRDALILFTILENIRGRPEDHSLVVTNDRRMAEGLNRHAAEFKTELAVVSTLDEAITHIDARVSAWYREHLFRESEQAKEMLGKFKQEIVAQLNRVRELTDFDLGVNSLSAMLGGPKVLEFGESIERVNSLSLEEIESAVWKDRDKVESRILFRMLCTANITTSSGPLNPYLAAHPTYVIGGGKQVSPSLFGTLIPRQERERAVSVWLYGEAGFERVNEEWRLLGVRVDKSQPGSDELAELLRVPRRKD
jgi:hypothetical protein